MSKTTDQVKAGYADFLNQTPWARCPMTFNEWKEGVQETPESIAYWNGFDAGTEDAYAKVTRAA